MRLFAGSLLAGKSHRDRQYKAQALLGVSGMLFFGLMLYEGVQTGKVRYLFSTCRSTTRSAEMTQKDI
jgi:hypothetical protein